MGWLSSWLREVIMIVLLATFVDMLLPNRSMERYVKLVLSLLILLTLLSPVTKLLRSDPVAELKRAMAAMDSPSDGNATLEQILAQGKQMLSNEQEQSLQWTAKELANVMKGQIEETTGERVQSVEVQLVMDTRQLETDSSSTLDLPVIQSVLVEMAASGVGNQSGSEQQDTAASTKPVFESGSVSDTEPSSSQQPIQIGQIEVPAVQVEVDTERSGNGTETGGSPAERTDERGADSKPVIGDQTDANPQQQGQGSNRSERAVQIITLLTEKWDIDANKVQVKEHKNAQAS